MNLPRVTHPHLLRNLRNHHVILDVLRRVRRLNHVFVYLIVRNIEFWVVLDRPILHCPRFLVGGVTPLRAHLLYVTENSFHLLVRESGFLLEVFKMTASHVMITHDMLREQISELRQRLGSCFDGRGVDLIQKTTFRPLCHSKSWDVYLPIFHCNLPFRKSLEKVIATCLFCQSR